MAMNFANFQSCMEVVASESLRMGYQQGLADQPHGKGVGPRFQQAAGAGEAGRQDPSERRDQRRLDLLEQVAEKLAVVECRQSHSTPDGHDALRHMDQLARGDIWTLPVGVGRQMEQLLKAGIQSYGHAKAATDSRRGQLHALQQAARARGARFGEDPECQDSQGAFALWLPQVRSALEASWHGEAQGQLDRLSPVPEWARKAMAGARPMDCSMRPVDPLATLRLMGFANDRQWSGSEPLASSLQEPHQQSQRAAAGSTTSSTSQQAHQHQPAARIARTSSATCPTSSRSTARTQGGSRTPASRARRCRITRTSSSKQPPAQPPNYQHHHPPTHPQDAPPTEKQIQQHILK